MCAGSGTGRRRSLQWAPGGEVVCAGEWRPRGRGLRVGTQMGHLGLLRRPGLKV
jgi:hypothetical protein